ncbi:MAG: 4Fe-4S binding protein, partial [Oscillospiraceae bacterium]|nr:4Fe-4S binding protein [Oscillospiraceae bacterium]
ARRSLDRDVIDIFLLHEQESVYTMQGHHEALETLLERKAKGIIRAVGLSTHHIAGVYAATLSGLDVVHPMFNIDGYGILDGGATQMAEAIETADRAGLGVFAMKALGGGNLFARAQECLRFVLNNPHIHAVALGCKSKEEVRANARFFETGKFLDHELGNLLTAQKHLHVADWCEGCGKCAAFCPHKAINIRDNQADVNPDKCVLCGYCGAKCPLFAIKIY